MTSLLDRAKAAYASDLDERQRAYDRETDELRRAFCSYLIESAVKILQVPSSSVLATVEPVNGGSLLVGTVLVEGVTFLLNLHRGDRPWHDNSVLYVLLPCTRCGEEYTDPVRSLHDLGKVLDRQYCSECRTGVQR